MQSFDLSFQRAGGRLLRQIPEAWIAGLSRHGQSPALIPLAEGVASFALDREPALAPATLRNLVLLALLVLVDQGAGSSGLPLSGPESQTFRDLAAEFGGDPEELLALLGQPAAAAMVGSPGERKPLILESDCLRSERLHRAESDLAQRLMARIPAANPEPLEVDEAVLARPTPLSQEQRSAVAAALSRPLTLITGGPGTGKTSIVVAILRAGLRSGLAPTGIALCAPTGKAANRMAGAIQDALGRLLELSPQDAPLRDLALAPQTLHRLLGFHPSGARFRHHEGAPLEARLVLVDEASMVDLVLMDRLLRALEPGARLVLMGDADQLPSVEAGSVFRDLIEALPQAVCRLETSYRMRKEDPHGRAILGAARKLLPPRSESLFEAPEPVQVRDRLAAVEYRGVELLDTDEPGLRSFLGAWLEDQVEGRGPFLEDLRRVFRWDPGGWSPADSEALARLFGHSSRSRILCPLREGPGLRGVAGLNRGLHERVLAGRERNLESRLAFALGEPVMLTRNDYARGVFNGDQGLMLLVARETGEPRLEAVFPQPAGYRAFPAGPMLHELELAYATTVHKAQGSEFDRVALVLPMEDHPLATREVLYTALTRARTSVLILGPQALLPLVADRQQRRWSGLGARLRADGDAHQP
jgi:exodeoxyribonuclease V alpha subunit